MSDKGDYRQCKDCQRGRLTLVTKHTKHGDLYFWRCNVCGVMRFAEKPPVPETTGGAK